MTSRKAFGAGGREPTLRHTVPEYIFAIMATMFYECCFHSEGHEHDLLCNMLCLDRHPDDSAPSMANLYTQISIPKPVEKTLSPLQSTSKEGLPWLHQGQLNSPDFMFPCTHMKLPLCIPSRPLVKIAPPRSVMILPNSSSAVLGLSQTCCRMRTCEVKGVCAFAPGVGTYFARRPSENKRCKLIKFEGLHNSLSGQLQVEFRRALRGCLHHAAQ